MKDNSVEDKKTKTKKNSEEKKVSTKKKSTTKKEVKVDKEVVKKTIVPKKSIKKVKDLEVNDKTKTKKNKNNTFSVKELLIIVLVTCMITSICTGSIMYFKFKGTNSITKNKLNEDTKLNEFVDIYSDIINNFYDEVDKDKIIDAAINGMVNELGDDYTSYLTQEESDALNEKLAGTYTGIGIQVQENVVVKVFKDGPADKAGILIGDKIMDINGTVIDESNYFTFTNIIKKGDVDTFAITIDREGNEKKFTVKRGILDYPAITYYFEEHKGKKIGYIYIETFSNTLARQMSNALVELENEGIDSLIIDVRGNTGGYLNAATDVASMFLNKGAVLYSLESKSGVKKYVDDTNENREYKIVVLVNGGTASSSEILAAALKDSYGATVIGTTTYGKGKVQTKKDLSNGNIVKFTNSKWLRPNGECVDKVGITPDYEIQLKVNAEGTEVIDTQYDKAIELLIK